MSLKIVSESVYNKYSCVLAVVAQLLTNAVHRNALNSADEVKENLDFRIQSVI